MMKDSLVGLDLASKQKPLGEEFTKVLNDNLDTLYGS